MIRHKVFTAALPSLLALTACQQQPTGTTTVTTNAATGSVTTTSSGAAPTVASMRIQPGKWETRVEVLDRKMTGLPPGIALPKTEPRTMTSCVTPEQASKGPGDMLKMANASCTATTSTFAGGKIALVMSCKLPNGTLAVKTSGSYSPTEVTTDSEVTMTGKVSSTEKTHSVARRLGDCG
ncbi:MAG: DUF3617 domain-containing protein [Pseudomonadota bacterium]